MKRRGLRITLGVVLATLFFLGCASKKANSMVQVNNNVDLKGVTALRIDDAWEVYVQQGNSNSIRLQIAEEHQNKVLVQVKGNTLYIRRKSDTSIFGNNTGDARCRAYITLKELNKVDIDGSSRIYFQTPFSSDKEFTLHVDGASKAYDLEISAKVVNIDVDGASKASIQRIDASSTHLDVDGASSIVAQNVGSEMLLADIDGSSNVTLSGTKAVSRATYLADGVSKIRANDLPAYRVKAEAGGVSKIHCQALEEIIAEADGVSSIHVYGNPPRISESDSGMSKVVIH